MSRKAWKPTKEDLENLREWSGRGLTMEQMAIGLGLHAATLWKYKAKNEGKNEISEALNKGKFKAVNHMTGLLWKIANKGTDGEGKSQMGALAMWLNNVAGWSQRHTIQTDPENPPTIVHKLPDLKGPRARSILDILLTAHGKKSKKKSPKKKPKPK